MTSREQPPGARKGFPTNLEFWNCFGRRRLFGHESRDSLSSSSSSSSYRRRRRTEVLRLRLMMMTGGGGGGVDEEREIHILRATNRRLEHETHFLRLANHRLEKELLTVREQLEGERQLVGTLKRRRAEELKTLREDEMKKFECAIKDLKTRFSVEQSQSLENQKLQLERNFRSELIKLVHQKDSQLHLLFTHSQRVKREADKRCVTDRQHYFETYQLHLEKLKQDFQQQLTRLLLEMKTKERHIESLQKTVLIVSSSNRSLLANSSPSPSSAKPSLITTSSSRGSRGRGGDSRPVPRNNKKFRGNRKQPYNPSGKRKYEKYELPTPLMMKEMGEQPEPFFYHHNYTGGTALETLPEAESEEECSEIEDVSEIVGNPSLLATSCSNSQGSDDNFSLSHHPPPQQHHLVLLDGSNFEPPDEPPPPPPTSITCNSFESPSSSDERHKIMSLETTIRQLRDELRECKDQNELLEFRLLEIEEIGENSSSQSGCEARKCGKSPRGVRGLLASDVALYHGTEASTDVTIRGETFCDDSSSNNSHASVAESRSSCSDCSDSISLHSTQESGIFDSQSQINDDYHMGTLSVTGYGNSLSPKEDISRELAHLTAQIEKLVIRFAEGGSNNNTNNNATSTNNNNSGDGTGVPGGGNEEGQGSRSGGESSSSPSLLLSSSVGGTRGGGGNKTKKGQDLMTELKSCRQRIQEFERRLTQFADFSYANSLEDKVALLVQENQRLEEERCELEEAENDSRHQCQRLEEKMIQLRQKKAFLQRQLGGEKLFIEQLRMKILQLQEREEELSTQILRVDSLECRNFELEESCIEMKCSIQFVAHSLPVLVLWYLWSVLRTLETLHPPSYSKKVTFPALPIISSLSSSSSYSVTGGVPRKHKLMSSCSVGGSVEKVTCAEPSFKKLKPGKDGERKESPFHVTTVDIGGDMEEGLNNIKPPMFLNLRLRQGSEDESTTTHNPKIDTASETCEEEWKSFINDIISVQYKEWQRVETLLRKKIELLECDMDQHKNVFNLERGKIIKHYEGKLSEQSNALEYSQKILEERRTLQDKWDSLVKELEEFVGAFGKNPINSLRKNLPVKESKEEVSQQQQQQESSMVKVKIVEGELPKIKSGGLVANRIRSLFPGELPPNKMTSPDLDTMTLPPSLPPRPPIPVKPKIIKVVTRSEMVERLEQAFQEQLEKFEKREKSFLEEIDRLKCEMGKRPPMMDASSCTTDEDSPLLHLQEERRNDADLAVTVGIEENSQIVYLSEENNRLQIILSDQESALSKVRELEEENEKLCTELAANQILRKRLEDAHGAETSLRNRIEELEQSEINTKESMEQVLRRERKCLERISQLREEIQFLRNKCCQLQDDVDLKISREDKYKNEIQILASKVKGLMVELEEKEILLENDATSSQSQISKLRSQLNDVSTQMADVECSNGMLREEVLYLERTLQEAMERAGSLEKTVGSLTGELGQREGTIETLQKQLENWTGPHSPSVQDENLSEGSNDLDIFAQNEGGLFGVDRDIRRIASQIQSCGRESCKSGSQKLNEVSAQLNTLTMMLGGGSPMDRVINGDSTGSFPERLSRCESDECLSRAMGGNGLMKDLQKTIEEDEPEEQIPEEVLPVEAKDDKDEGNSETKSLKSKLCQLEEREKKLRESHLTECSWYNSRCRQKNRLILVLSRRIAHVSVTDKQGIFLETILNEIRQLEREHDIWPPTYYHSSRPDSPTDPQETQLNINELDFSCETLCLFLNYERKRIMRLMESAFQEGSIESPLDGSDIVEEEEVDRELEFKICRRISEDSLLVSWTIPDKYAMKKVDGYEISVNGNVFLRIRDSQRFKVVLFGLDLSQPLHLSLKCTGATVQESTLTYIA